MSSEAERVFSRVETVAIDESPLDPIYPPDEKIPVITVSNFPALGQLVAMRFLEWVQQNPGASFLCRRGRRRSTSLNG
jgi:hypothetical protein